MEHKEKKSQANKGITLIASVVTIVVLIILATVSINAVLGQNGIIKKAKQAKEMYSNSIAKDNEEMDRLLNEMASSGAHVPKAATVKALIILDILKLVAIELIASINISEHLIKRTNPTINNTIAFNMLATYYINIINYL